MAVSTTVWFKQSIYIINPSCFGMSSQKHNPILPYTIYLAIELIEISTELLNNYPTRGTFY